jgi:hypothetical protein
MKLKPYIICKGRKFKKEKLKKLIRPISNQKRSIISNYNLSEKSKIKFITQLFRWVRKDVRHYRINYFLKKKYIISNCDIINFSVKIQKAGWKKLLLKLNYLLKDYKELKRRSYTLNFKFFFINIEDNKNKEITIDIRSTFFDSFNIFMTTNSFYIEDFYYIINVLNNKACKKKDENDLLLEDLNYIFNWMRVNKTICYDVYMPWYLTKENYYIKWRYKRKNERKYYCFIKEKKFNSIFPLKKVIGHLIVTDKEKRDNKSNFIYWKTIFKNDTFKNKDDLFKELKMLIKRINKKYNINSTLVYFFIKLN